MGTGLKNNGETETGAGGSGGRTDAEEGVEAVVVLGPQQALGPNSTAKEQAFRRPYSCQAQLAGVRGDLHTFRTSERMVAGL